MSEPEFHAGQFVIYEKGDTRQLGLIKSICEDRKAFVWYHSGETAARTRFEDMHPIENDQMISRTQLGGDDARTAVGTVVKRYTVEQNGDIDSIETCSECGSVNIENFCAYCGVELVRE